MDDAVAYSGAIDFLAWAREERRDLVIVSHRTRRPFLGRPYDLHDAARKWVNKFLIDRPQPLISGAETYFEPTKKEKLARIAGLDLDVFIDDLPEILLADEFPRRTARVLFDPDGTYPANDRLPVCASWGEIKRHVQDTWKTRN